MVLVKIIIAPCFDWSELFYDVVKINFFLFLHSAEESYKVCLWPVDILKYEILSFNV